MILGSGPLAASEPLREQSVVLTKGWNAVFLEVDPVENSPTTLFADVPVDIVARYFRLVTPVQFISDPADEPWKTKGWGVWYAPDREDAFLTSLHAIQGNQCYLIHAKEATTWQVTGVVRYRRTSWKTDSFNLFGACVDPSGPPTFGQFYSGTEGKIGTRIYRLTEGKWAKINNPQSTTMRPGEACWVFCSGQTDYQGPLNVTVAGGDGLDFGTKGTRQEIAIRNALPVPATLSVTTVAPSGGGTELPLNQVVRDLSLAETRYPAVASLLAVPTLAAGTETQITFQLRRERMSAAEQSTLLRITSDSGAVVWLPVKATDPERTSSN